MNLFNYSAIYIHKNINTINILNTFYIGIYLKYKWKKFIFNWKNAFIDFIIYLYLIFFLFYIWYFESFTNHHRQKNRFGDLQNICKLFKIECCRQKPKTWAFGEIGYLAFHRQYKWAFYYYFIWYIIQIIQLFCNIQKITFFYWENLIDY